MLIAVLFSTMALPEALSIGLYRAALALEAEGRGVEKLTGDLAMGEVRRLGKTLSLGSLVGPAFDAELDTPAGSGRVRFIVTEQALRHEGLASRPRLTRSIERGTCASSVLR
jgi:hypothetical protein